MSHRTVIVLLAAALTLPAVASAGWGARGDIEPSTEADASDGYMWLAPNTAADNKVYFNGFAGAYIGYAAGVRTTVNPNVGVLGSGHQSYPYVALAMLGVWRDCNGDGYVGLGEQGMREYPVALGGTSAICPREPIPATVPNNWKPVHNDGTIVRELIPIGWDYNKHGGQQGCKTATPNLCNDKNIYHINDSQSRVWADWDLPGSTPGTQCYVRPHPSGTFHSVGGVQSYADCFASNRIINTIDGAGLGPTYQSVKGGNCYESYVLDSYQVGCNPWGEPRQEAYVDAFDCRENAQLFMAPQHVDKDGDGQRDDDEVKIGSTVNVSHPRSAPSTTTRGSVAGTLNETSNEFDNCRGNEWGDPGGSALPYSTEASLDNQNGRRFQHDQEMAYNEGQRPSAPIAVYMALGGKSGSDDFGTGTSFEGLWEGSSVTAASRNPYVNRDTVQPMPVTYTTFYAYVGALAVSDYSLRLPGVVGKYGSEACGIGIGPDAPDRNQWACDPGEWWPNTEDGRSTMRRATLSVGTVDINVRVGQEYQLRDIDCWDESVSALRAEGVHYGILTSTRCE